MRIFLNRNRAKEVFFFSPEKCKELNVRLLHDDNSIRKKSLKLSEPSMIIYIDRQASIKLLTRDVCCFSYILNHTFMCICRELESNLNIMYESSFSWRSVAFSLLSLTGSFFLLLFLIQYLFKYSSWTVFDEKNRQFFFKLIFREWSNK